MRPKPKHHFLEAVRQAGEAWGILEDSTNEPNRKLAAAMLRQVVDIIDPQPVTPAPQPIRPPDVVPAPPRERGPNVKFLGLMTPVESSREEWWPSIGLCAQALGKSYAAVVRTIGGKQPTCAGRCLWRSKHPTLAAWSAARPAGETT